MDVGAVAAGTLLTFGPVQDEDSNPTSTHGTSTVLQE